MKSGPYRSADCVNADFPAATRSLPGARQKEDAMPRQTTDRWWMSETVRRRSLLVVLVSTFATAPVGCNNAGEGALSGAALGALGGMAIGSLTGDMGKGAVVGAVLGGLGGLVLGDQNERNDRRSGR